MVSDEFFVELVEQHTVIARHSTDDALVFETDQVSVHGALCQTRIPAEHVSDAYRSGEVEQKVDELASASGVDGLAATKTISDERVHCIAALLHEYERNSHCTSLKPWQH
ncbi:MAG: hypothetical protein RL072_238 [Actinomycetota bacterium]